MSVGAHGPATGPSIDKRRPPVGRKADVHGPAIGKVFARIAAGGAPGVDLATARRALPGAWGGLTAPGRGCILPGIGCRITAEAEELALLAGALGVVPGLGKEADATLAEPSGPRLHPLRRQPGSWRLHSGSRRAQPHRPHTDTWRRVLADRRQRRGCGHGGAGHPQGHRAELWSDLFGGRERAPHGRRGAAAGRSLGREPGRGICRGPEPVRRRATRQPAGSGAGVRSCPVHPTLNHRGRRCRPLHRLCPDRGVVARYRTGHAHGAPDRGGPRLRQRPGRGWRHQFAIQENMQGRTWPGKGVRGAP